MTPASTVAIERAMNRIGHTVTSVPPMTRFIMSVEAVRNVTRLKSQIGRMLYGDVLEADEIRLEYVCPASGGYPFYALVIAGNIRGIVDLPGKPSMVELQIQLAHLLHRLGVDAIATTLHICISELDTLKKDKHQRLFTVKDVRDKARQCATP